MHTTADSFGARLAQLRQDAGLSQQALADQLSVTRQAVSNWERNQTLPDLDLLLSLAQALGTDLNTLGGSSAPRRGRGIRRKVRAVSALICLCAAFIGGGCLSRAAFPSDGPAPVLTPSAPEPSLSVSASPHKIRYTTPEGITVITAADGWEELSDVLAALPGSGSGPVERTYTLSDTLCYFAAQYELRFAPCYDGESGRFSSWDQVLFWLYKAGISAGGIMTTEQVDNAISTLFGSETRYEHQSTRHFSLTDEGYRPVDVGTVSAEPYTLVSFSRLEPGVYEAVLREQDGPWIAVTLASGDETLRLRSLARSEEPSELPC